MKLHTVIAFAHHDPIASFTIEGVNLRTLLRHFHDAIPDREGIGNDSHTLVWNLINKGITDLTLLDGSNWTFVLKEPAA